jgi:hypothetical protein
MATKMSKKGQGLALVSILVLIAILYFIFRFNTETYGFIMQAGDEQAHLVTAYTEGAKAKSYVQTAARDAAFEVVWNIGNKNPAAAALSQFCIQDAASGPMFKELFDKYLAMYSPSSPLVETSIPGYRFKSSCPHALEIEGFGYDESCKLKRNFPVPELPCEDQPNATACAAIKFTTDKSKNACTWNQKLNCTNSQPAPNCSGASNSAECAAASSSYCSWEISYSEKINVISAPLINYQFSIDTDAHFIETISGSEYETFAEIRRKVA